MVVLRLSVRGSQDSSLTAFFSWMTPLAPDIVMAIVAERQPRHLNLCLARGRTHDGPALRGANWNFCPGDESHLPVSRLHEINPVFNRRLML